MIIKITYPFKNNAQTLDLKNIFLETNDNNLISKLKSTNNPIESGVILSENEGKYKKIKPTKEDIHIEITEIITSPELRKKFNF
jgi:hypothetical protein